MFLWVIISVFSKKKPCSVLKMLRQLSRVRLLTSFCQNAWNASNSWKLLWLVHYLQVQGSSYRFPETEPRQQSWYSRFPTGSLKFFFFRIVLYLVKFIICKWNWDVQYYKYFTEIWYTFQKSTLLNWSNFFLLRI